MTIRAVSGQATEDYRAEPASGTPPERVRVVLVAGSGSVASDDLYPLLLRRLRTSSLIVTVVTILLLAYTLLVIWDSIRTGRIEQPGRYALAWQWASLRGVPALVSIGIFLLLWRRPPGSVRGLRLIELILVSVLAGNLVTDNVLSFGWWLREPTVTADPRMAEGMYVAWVTLFWYCLITWYGALIPNTWRRSASVVGTLALTPLVLFAVQAFWLQPFPTIPALFLLFIHTVFIGMAAAVAIFSSARIEILRQQAAEARKLGQYVLKEQLGSGGMGEVYRAEHVLLRRPCALKLIRPERAGDPKNLRRFEREVQVTATLTHPNTVQIYDYGHADDGTFYYVMEYLPGVTLEELVKSEGPLSPVRAVHFLRQICGALRGAHGRGLIHRDIKPGNVMICERGGIRDVAKLLDFGLVLPPVSEHVGEKLTQDGTVTGTPAYLSPEQADGRDKVDARSDIYSLGALAYFLLTGQPPFANRSGVKMLAAHLYEEPEPLSIRRPSVPRDLEAVVLRCLGKMPEARFPDIATLDAALAVCAVVGVEVANDGQAGRTV